MLFNSVEFALFFPVAVAGAFLVPRRWRWAWLLAGSYLFYGWWRVEYLGLIACSTLVDYLAALRMGGLPTRAARRPWLALSLLANGAILFGFKYFNFFGETANAFLGYVRADGSVPVLDVLLPVGISFYTFQTVAYSVDVYRGQIEPERHLGYFALYVSFWPQLVAGPIERARDLLPQLRAPRAFDGTDALAGLRLMAWGLFLKVAVADRVAPFVADVFGTPQAFGAADTWFVFYAGGFLFYADFAGYSLMAIGAARTLGVRLSDNFREPYFAPTMAELWRRWHITLMTWIRDYLYVPMLSLQGRRSQAWRALTVLTVFTAVGLWHGAAWTFVLWGVWMGAYVVAEGVVAPPLRAAWGRLPGPSLGVGTALAVLLTFHVWILGALLFRVHALADTWPLARNLLGLHDGPRDLLASHPYGSFQGALIGLGIGAVLAVDTVRRRPGLRARWQRLPVPARAAVYAALLLAVLCLGEFGAQPFMYFQF